MTNTDEVLIFLAQLSIAAFFIVCALWVADQLVKAIQSKMLDYQLKRTPYVLNNTEKENDL